MKKFKLLSVLMAMLLSMSVFASCSEAPADDDVKEPAPDAEKEPEKEPGKEADSGETVTLTWWQIGTQPSNLEDVVKEMNAYTKEKINVEIDLKFADWGVWSDKITTMVNAGEEWDIMFTNGGFYSSHVLQGSYADITELLKTETPELYSYIPPMLWQGATVQDKIYSVPTYKDSAQTQYWVWDKELVEHYNIDIANTLTLEQIDPILRQIQTDHYDGTGKYSFDIPQVGINGKYMHYDNPSAVEGMGVRYDDETLTVVNVFEQEEIMKDAIITHGWYNDGLISPDAATKAEGAKGRNPLGSAQAFPGAEAGFAINAGGFDVVMVPWSDTVYSTGTILGSTNAISSASPNQAAALKYLELVNLDPTLRNMYAYGSESVNFEYNDDGTVTKLDDMWTAPGYSQATFFTMAPLAPNPPTQWEVVKEQMDTGIPSVLLGFSFDPAPVETQIANTKAVFDRYKFDYFSGTVDPEVAVPEMYAEMDAVGYSEVKEELQAQINVWAGK